MTPERLAELKALTDAATPGPWRTGAKGAEGLTSFGGEFCTCCPPGEGSYGELIGEVPENDAQFIAAARTAVPELVAEVERLQAQILAVQQALNRHPECDQYAPGDTITCGWKRAVHDITYALEEEADE